MEILKQDTFDETLPREMLALCAIAPIAATPLVLPRFFELPLQHVIRAFAAMEVAWIVIPICFWIFYYVFRRQFARLSGVKEWIVHLLMAVVLAPVFGELARPLHNFVLQTDVTRIEFAKISVAFSCLTLFPSIAYQNIRRKAYRLEQRAREERQLALQAQLAALQARTQPHFFFNSLNTVASLIPDDPALAERTLERLAELFRYALDASKISTVALKREVEVIQDYLEIQRARFGEPFRSSIEFDETLKDIPVPPLLLQPLVENAVVHGLNDRSSGEIRIRIHNAGNEAVIEVHDDGPGPNQSTHRGTQTSLRDLAQRLQLAYGTSASIQLEPRPEGGTVARLRLPREHR